MGLFDDKYTSKLAQALQGYGSGISNAYDGVRNWGNELQTFTNTASDEADRRFPDQARDDSQKNAFRHALGAGRLAQLLGSDSGIPLISGAARGVAKLSGYGWEGLGGQDNWGSTDMRHDLNANAIGIDQSSNVQGYNALADRLESIAKNARFESPPDVFSKARQYFTYTK